MKEIAPNVFIEENSLGLVAGVIRNEGGGILIDSPVRNISGSTWKEMAGSPSGEKACYLVVLDSNYDRLLSIKGSDCVIVAHSEAISPLRNRSNPPKSSDESTQGSESQETSITGNRTLPPDLNFDNELSLHLNGLMVNLQHHPGSNQAGIWVDIPDRKVVFVGDTVIVDQPPFLAYADLKAWEEDLDLLLTKKYSDYQVVSARSGLIDRDQIEQMKKRVAYIREKFDNLRAANAPLEDWYPEITNISAQAGQLDLFNSELFYNRLHWGITTYYDLNCREKG